MKIYRLQKSLLVILFFLIYLKIILFEVEFEFNKPSDIKNIVPLPMPLSLPKPLLPFTPKKPAHLASKSVSSLLKSNIKNNTVLIFEPAFYHHECTPGFTKYFLDLGYNIDVILDGFGRNTFCFFDLLENVRLFVFFSLSQLNSHSEEYRSIFKNYSYIVIETSDGSQKKTFENLGFFQMNNSIFVVHQFEYINSTGITSLCNQNRVWSLGNLKNTLMVNPHYFGDFKIRNKNNITKFFLTSTGGRNYNDLVLAAEKLKNENLNFEVIVVGKVRAFTDKILSENLKSYFKFKYRVIFKELYEAVDSCDYIIINLYPNYEYNDQFRTVKLTGASQLSLGFLKPAFIHKDFAEFYNRSSENSFLFDNSSLYEEMRKAILLNDQEYKEKQSNLYKLSNSLYNISLQNIIKSLNSILIQ